MRRDLLIAAVALAVLAAGCSRTLVIPSGTLSEIFADMFIADQWLRENRQLRKEADTTLFYEPLFNSHGYTTAYFRKTIDEYMYTPDKLDKILEKTVKILDERRNDLQKIQDRIDSAAAIKEMLGVFEKIDFQSDSTLLKDTMFVWNPNKTIDSTNINKYEISGEIQLSAGGRTDFFKHPDDSLKPRKFEIRKSPERLLRPDGHHDTPPSRHGEEREGVRR